MAKNNKDSTNPYTCNYAHALTHMNTRMQPNYYEHLRVTEPEILEIDKIIINTSLSTGIRCLALKKWFRLNPTISHY